MRFVPLIALVLCTATLGTVPARAQALRDTISFEPVEDLAKAVRAEGDAARGALAFHQATLACSKCHSVDGSARSLGPDLSKLGREVTVEQLIESVLNPSKTIKPGFVPVIVQTTDGRSITGLLIEETPERIVLREATVEGAPVTIPKTDIEDRQTSKASLMPADVVNQLADRRQFLDLLRYLSEIAAGGPERARQLQPAASLLVVQLPEYERNIDHAGLITALDKKSFNRGSEIYEGLCRNCHGTKEQPGSLPTSLRFATGKFKNGSDPFRMYQTLTHGFGLMAPQGWMVPRQKYDVIHYIREAYLKDANPSQYFHVDPPYLAALPKGTSRGPAPKRYEPWATMNYGPYLTASYEVGDDGSNFAYKGIAVRLDPGPGGIVAGRNWMLFDHDTLRVAAAWTGKGFIDFNGIMFNGKHNIHPRLVGEVQLANRSGPGWANPENGSFDDPRLLGRDGRHYGPLPRSWGKFLGYYQHGDRLVFSYKIGETEVLESPSLAVDPEKPIFTRTFEIGPRTREMILEVAQDRAAVAKLTRLSFDAPFPVVAFGSPTLNVGLLFPLVGDGAELPEGFSVGPEGQLLLELPPGKGVLRFQLRMTREMPFRLFAGVQKFVDPMRAETPIDLRSLTHGGPRRWPQVLKTTAALGPDDGAFAVDTLTLPTANPWSCQMRLTGFDFFRDGNRAAVCSWDGDVWLVSGLSQLSAAGSCELSWQRIASGLFQPLGVKIVDEQVYVSCRDQIVILRDTNGDGETDFYQCFNDDHQVTEHFHEFAMGLQTDAAGNFYYAKSARHALPAVVPHHGTLLRVSPDGSKTDILATGFRAANGVCVNADGTFVVTDQEGHWNPKNRINWVKPGGFYGNMFGYHDVTDSSDQAMQQPLCWITNEFDRSPAELLWVPKDCWGPLGGSLLNLSYGYGKVYVVPYEEIGVAEQGGMCQLPLASLPTGIMRGRFHPQDKQLYTCGMFAWAGSATQPGGFYRIRSTGRPAYLPLELHARPGGISITFSDPLDPAVAGDASRYRVQTWSLKRTENYGSDHYDQKALRVTKATLSADRRTVFLEMPDIRPTWCMSIECSLTGERGQPVNRLIHNTIHALAD